jgi:hypothetical protein
LFDRVFTGGNHWSLVGAGTSIWGSPKGSRAMHPSLAPDAVRAYRPMGITALIRHHPLVAYFLLAFGISWGGIALVAGPLGFSGGALMVAMLMAIESGSCDTQA